MIVATEAMKRLKTPTSPELEFFKPLCNGWLGKIETSRQSPQRKRWSKQAEDCMKFFSMTAKLQDIVGRSTDGSFSALKHAPKFQFVISKAFELVAQIGPSLFFNVPDRKVHPKKIKELPQELFGDVQNDPNAQQMYQMHEQERVSENAVCEARAQLLEHWLSYTPREMPGGGLESHALRAITEALIKGRGVLWSEPYTKAGSDSTLTGLFYDSVDNLFIDPDAEKIEDIRWIAQRVVEHHRDAEERFDLPRDSLKNRCNLESAFAEAERIKNEGESSHLGVNGQTKDMICYYKIWSKMGIGLEYVGGDAGVNKHLEKVVGKYAYMVVSSTVPYPLNAPSNAVRNGATEKQVEEMFQWPIPYWTDDLWPCEFLDFYPEPNNIWPLAPLTPAMPELKFLSIMMSHLCNRIWMSSRSFIAVTKAAMSEVSDIIKNGDDLAVLPIGDSHGGVDKMISFLKQPEVNMDAWTIIDRVAQQFDKNTGLTDLVYGMSNTQSRSAEDAAIKGQAIAVRPDYMSKQVERWMAEASRKEAFCTRWFVSAMDVAPLLGQVGARLWSALIDEEDVEKVIREMEYTIAAGSAKRRNRQEELANLNQALQFFFPEISKHADVTTDTSAINALIQRWAEAAEIDLSDVVLGQRMPPPQEGPSPEEVEMQLKQQEHEMDMQGKAIDQQMDQQLHQLKIQELMAKVQAQAAQTQLKQAGDAAKIRTKQRSELLDMLMDRQEHNQELDQQEETHDQELSLLQERARLELEVAREKAAAEIQAMKERARIQAQQAKKKPETSASK